MTTYLGVPYAQPPIGQLRFAAPVTPPDPWTEPRNATEFAPSCLQVPGGKKLHEKLFRELLPADWMDPGVNEDCLYLNLYIPDGKFNGKNNFFILLNIKLSSINIIRTS